MNLLNSNKQKIFKIKAKIYKYKMEFNLNNIFLMNKMKNEIK